MADGGLQLTCVSPPWLACGRMASATREAQGGHTAQHSTVPQCFLGAHVCLLSRKPLRQENAQANIPRASKLPSQRKKKPADVVSRLRLKTLPLIRRLCRATIKIHVPFITTGTPVHSLLIQPVIATGFLAARQGAPALFGTGVWVWVPPGGRGSGVWNDTSKGRQSQGSV